MNCPQCDGKMEHGYIAAGCASAGAATRLEWYDRRPELPLVGSIPLTKFQSLSNAEGYRCKSCRLFVASY